MKYGKACFDLTVDTRPSGPKKSEMGRLVHLVASTGGSDCYTGKRYTKRFAKGIRFEATTDANRPAEVWPVTMHNISPEGLGFWSRRPVDLHQPVCLREFSAHGPADWVLAKVTHCTRGLRGYLIGAKAVK